MIEILYTLITTYITIICVTLYLHRGQAHRAITFHPIVAHTMRFWLWLTTGMVTQVWVAIHRKHHRFCENPGDPHSPHIFGIWNVLFNGVNLYRKAAKDKKMIQEYGKGCPDDWIERHIYSKLSWLGISILLSIDILLFGLTGIIIWAVQMLWIPLLAAGVINGLGHWLGYRNGQTRDHSTNILPIGLLIGGEELHNNHHLDPGNPKLSRRWFEFDSGYFILKCLKYIKLAEINYKTRG